MDNHEQIEKLEESTYKKYYYLLDYIRGKIDKGEREGMPLASLKKDILEKWNKDIDKLKKVEIMYVRLKEKYKHEKIDILIKIAIDWSDYVSDYSNLFSNVESWEMNWDELRREKARLYEIERRFSKILSD